MVYYATEQCRKRLEACSNAVVTLNTYCDIAGLTLQLPHITTGFLRATNDNPQLAFQSPQRLKERNKP